MIFILAILSILCAITALSISQKDYQKIIKRDYNMNLFRFIFTKHTLFPKLTLRVFIGLFLGLIIGYILPIAIGIIIFFIHKIFGYNNDLYLNLITITSNNGYPGVEVSYLTIYIIAFIIATLSVTKYLEKSIATHCLKL